jgi:putative Holliday junction resolvase
MRILAIDFGEKRIGLALSDPDANLALPLTTLNRRSDKEAIVAIAQIVQDQQVGLLVVGEPLNMDGSRGDSARRTASFARKLQSATGLRCVMVDETLTSIAARDRLIEAGVDLRRHPERVDAVAAQLLLEEFLANSDPSSQND